MKKLTGLAALTLALCLAALGAFAQNGHANEAIRIGLMGPMTGSWASEGQEMKQVVELLAEQYNQAGGVLGRKIEILTEDDGSDPRTASLAANKLATRNIVAVIGTYGSSITEASQSIFDEAGIVQIANGSTAVRLSAKGMPNFFRTCPRDDDQGKMAASALKKLGAKKVSQATSLVQPIVMTMQFLRLNQLYLTSSMKPELILILLVRLMTSSTKLESTMT